MNKNNHYKLCHYKFHKGPPLEFDFASIRHNCKPKPLIIFWNYRIPETNQKWDFSERAHDIDVINYHITMWDFNLIYICTLIEKNPICSFNFLAQKQERTTSWYKHISDQRIHGSLIGGFLSWSYGKNKCWHLLTTVDDSWWHMVLQTESQLNTPIWY